MFKVWDPETWSFSRPLKIFVPKKFTLQELGPLLQEHGLEIACKNMEICKILGSWNFSRV